VAIFTDDDHPCDNFEQLDAEENFDVCKHCQYHRLDHEMNIGKLFEK
jgi:hypothetical protein